MDRYHDNVSPDPNSMIHPNNCYKTPDYHLHSGLSLHQNALYPTPPSDNDDTSSNSSYILSTDLRKSQNDFMSTPTILSNQYSSNIANGEEVQQVTNPVNTNSSRYRRRSRTTYSKSQLDVLESTFQKTHYPEIRMVDDLSSMLSLSTERISIWFQNRRARFKKSRKLETTQENAAYVSGPILQAPVTTNSSPINENSLGNSTQSYINDKSYLNYGYGSIGQNFSACKPILESKSINTMSHANTFPYSNQMHGQHMVPAITHVNTHNPFSYSNQIDSR